LETLQGVKPPEYTAEDTTTEQEAETEPLTSDTEKEAERAEEKDVENPNPEAEAFLAKQTTTGKVSSYLTRQGAVLEDPEKGAVVSEEKEKESSSLPLPAFIMAENTKCKIGCACGVLVVSTIVIVSLIVSSLHTIDEGYIGVYYKYGALKEATSEPGIHTMQPLVSTVKQILIRPETDTMMTIEAITQDGIQIWFKGVQVISRVTKSKVVDVIKKFGSDFKSPLVFDRVKADIKIFCANNTIDDIYNKRFLDMVAEVRERVESSIKRLGGGVEIMNLVIPKPDIPDDIQENYKAVKVQWTAQLVSTQQKKTEEIKKETEMLRAIADAERKKSVLAITIQQQILEKEGAQNVSRIANEILREKEENIANIEKYKIEQRAKANQALYTPEYIKLKMAETMSNNTKFYFSGENSPMGSIFSKLITKR